MVPRVVPLISVSYKYNMCKVLSLVDTLDTGIKKAYIPYLYHYPDPFSNFFILPGTHPLIMSNFFGSVNEVESHKKSRNSDSELEKFWVTQCGWLLLCTTVDMVINITNLWKLFHYGFNRDHCEKLIGIRELSERLDLDFFKYIFLN